MRSRCARGRMRCWRPRRPPARPPAAREPGRARQRALARGPAPQQSRRWPAGRQAPAPPPARTVLDHVLGRPCLAPLCSRCWPAERPLHALRPALPARCRAHGQAHGERRPAHSRGSLCTRCWPAVSRPGWRPAASAPDQARRPPRARMRVCTRGPRWAPPDRNGWTERQRARAGGQALRP